MSSSSRSSSKRSRQKTSTAPGVPPRKDVIALMQLRILLKEEMRKEKKTNLVSEEELTRRVKEEWEKLNPLERNELRKMSRGRAQFSFSPVRHDSKSHQDDNRDGNTSEFGSGEADQTSGKATESKACDIIDNENEKQICKDDATISSHSKRGTQLSHASVAPIVPYIRNKYIYFPKQSQHLLSWKRLLAYRIAKAHSPSCKSDPSVQSHVQSKIEKLSKFANFENEDAWRECLKECDIGDSHEQNESDYMSATESAKKPKLIQRSDAGKLKLELRYGYPKELRKRKQPVDESEEPIAQRQLSASSQASEREQDAYASEEESLHALFTSQADNPPTTNEQTSSSLVNVQEVGLMYRFIEKSHVPGHFEVLIPLPSYALKISRRVKAFGGAEYIKRRSVERLPQKFTSVEQAVLAYDACVRKLFAYSGYSFRTDEQSNEWVYSSDQSGWKRPFRVFLNQLYQENREQVLSLQARESEELSEAREGVVEYHKRHRLDKYSFFEKPFCEIKQEYQAYLQQRLVEWTGTRDFSSLSGWRRRCAALGAVRNVSVPSRPSKSEYANPFERPRESRKRRKVAREDFDEKELSDEAEGVHHDDPRRGDESVSVEDSGERDIKYSAVTQTEQV